MPTDPIVPATEPTTITNPPPVEINPTEKRIKDLSGDVKKFATERDEAILREQAATKLANFADSFVDIVATNPAAKEYKDQIKEKVLSGYSMQDATYAVLGPVGKLGNQPQKNYMPITGGSAPTIISNNSATKPINDMNREEMRDALMKAQGKGDLFLSS